MLHRKDGKLVRQNDDLMSATIEVVMMLRFAQNVPLGSAKPSGSQQLVARDVDFDVW